MIDGNIMNGKVVAENLLQQVALKLQELSYSPRLTIIQVGNDPASSTYVRMKQQKASDYSILTTVYHITDLHRIKQQIQMCIDQAQRSTVDGIMIQLPLPKHENTSELIHLIPHHLDVDGLREDSAYPPAVVTAILEMMRHYNVPNKVTTITVLGQGTNVGRPLTKFLKAMYPEHTISVVDEFTRNTTDILSTAECVISCVGKPHAFDSALLQKGAFLIDVGTSKHPIHQKIVGDFSHSNGTEHLQGYTPVPGGIGPITVASLLMHTVASALKKTTQD